MKKIQLYVKETHGEFHIIGVVPEKEVYFLGHSSEAGQVQDKIRKYASELDIPDEHVFFKGTAFKDAFPKG